MSRHSALDPVHRALGAKMVPFGGWEMPLSYPSGTLEEHRACREGAVAFDVSHLGTVRVEGPRALESLQNALTNDLGKVAPGRAQYTHLLDDDDASVLDDIIVWWIADDVFDVMPNASNTDRVTEALRSEASGSPDDLRIADTTSTRSIIAIQGPEARARLATVLDEPSGIGRFRVGSFTFEGRDCLVAGTGYTGEDGLECAVPNEVATSFWETVTGAGIVPAGLGARDTLRLEAALPLHGHELGPGITPLNAGLGWVVSWTKGPFRGRAALQRQRDEGVSPVLRGLRTEGRRPPRADLEVRRDGAAVGTTSSGNFSPTLGYGIALAFVDPSVMPGDALTVELRGTELAATCVELPFLAKP